MTTQPEALLHPDWLRPGAIVPVDAETTGQLLDAMRRLHAANVYASDLLVQATDDIRVMRAQVEALVAAARQALASGAHIYAGDCPDDTQPEANDPACPACRAIVALRAALEGQA